FKNVLLQLLQQGITGRRVEQVHTATIDIGKARFVGAALIVLVQQVDVVAPLLSPGGQQRMGMLVQQAVVQLDRHAGTALLASVLMPQQVLIGNDIAPVVLAGV